MKNYAQTPFKSDSQHGKQHFEFCGFVLFGVCTFSANPWPLTTTASHLSLLQNRPLTIFPNCTFWLWQLSPMEIFLWISKPSEMDVEPYYNRMGLDTGIHSWYRAPKEYPQPATFPGKIQKSTSLVAVVQLRRKWQVGQRHIEVGPMRPISSSSQSPPFTSRATVCNRHLLSEINKGSLGLTDCHSSTQWNLSTLDWHKCISAILSISRIKDQGSRIKDQCSNVKKIYVQGVFFNWYPPKKLKYGKPRLGESTLT